MTPPKKPIESMWQRDFRPEEIAAYRRYDKASNECLSFFWDKRNRAGLTQETIECIGDSLRSKEERTLAHLVATLKKRRLDPADAVRRMDRLNFGPAQEAAP